MALSGMAQAYLIKIKFGIAQTELNGIQFNTGINQKIPRHEYDRSF
jgi:hypothetical protein